MGNSMTTGEKLRQAREKVGLGRPEVSERTGIPVRSLEKIEQGVVAEPKLVDVATLAAVYGKTCADFLPDGKSSPPPPPVGRPKGRK